MIRRTLSFAASLITASTGPSTTTLMMLPARDASMTPGSCLERSDGRRTGDVQLDPLPRLTLELGDAGDRDELPFAEDPDAVGQHLDLGQDVRREEHGRAVALHVPDELVELVLQQGVEALRRLVQDVELRTVHERLDDADLALVPRRQLPDRTTRVELEPLDERLSTHARSYPPRSVP